MESEDQPDKTPKNEEKIQFKKPVLFGRIGKLPKKVKSEPETTPQEKDSEKVEAKNDSKKPKSSLPPAVLLTELSTPIPYKEPKWSGLCPEGSAYGLEVLKSGMIVDNIDLTLKSYFVFGRLANSDVVLAHPTISRHHAVLQYKAFAEDSEPPSGWYLYDLNSTHGTFLNRLRVKPQHYTRVRVGHHLKFGTSTRTYVVLGPDFDCEGESDLTVTEIKHKAQEMKLQRDRMIQDAIEQRERDKLEEERRREEQGIDWGMGEDAEDETDLSENPYASTNNEELYLTDPKKTLRGYCEREGHELQYNCEERGPGQFLCRVELPLDDARGRPVVAEVIHRGKKKEAVIACALEACRVLDRAGLLRQAKHESRRRKERDWSADDYYDSDDDTFLDRTGSVEKKRTERMRRHNAAGREDAQAPLTYDDLLKQVTEIEEKIKTEELSLERLRATNKPQETGQSETDALDEYMSSLGRQGQSMAQKAEISKTKMSIAKLKQDLTKSRRLAELARPALPPPPRAPPAPPAPTNCIPVRVANSVVIGKRIRLKEDTLKQKKVIRETKQEETEFVEEVDSDDEEEKPNEETTLKKQNEESIQQNTTRESSSTKNEIDRSKESEKEDMKDSTSEKEKVKRMFGPMRPPENYVIPENYFDQETDRDLPEIEEKDSL